MQIGYYLSCHVSEYRVVACGIAYTPVYDSINIDRCVDYTVEREKMLEVQYHVLLSQNPISVDFQLLS